jgi:hypothetical protein
MKTIKMIDDSERFDACHRKYRRAIYNTLLELKPRYCFEIGTHIFQTASMFSKYFEEQNVDGHLITCDISIWGKDVAPYRVHRVMVYPHNDEIQKNHGNIEVYHKDYKDHLDTSLEDNIKLLREKMDELGIEKFDLAFIDGDHEYQSFFRDLQTAKALVKEDGWLIIDDIEDPNHQQIVAYQELKDQTKFYEYEDWSPKPGIALIQNKDLVV